MLDTGLRALAFAGGAFMVVTTVLAAIRSFVLPRNESVLLNNWIFTGIRRVFTLMTSLGRTYGQRDRVMALYAPVGLVALPIAWLGVVSFGYTAIFWALGEGDLDRCYRISNSSLLTLGSEEPSEGVVATVMSYSEATLGLLLMTLLISYLPTIYQAYSRRELVIARLDLRTGTSTSTVGLVRWMHQTGSISDEKDQWQQWEEWFVEIEESHTSLPILSFFRSPQPGRSWIMASDIILETAALLISVIDAPRNPHMVLCFKAGCLAINRVSRFFKYEADTEEPEPPSDEEPVEDPKYQDFQKACQELQEAGISLQVDQQAAWRKYQKLRGEYAAAIHYLANLTMAPQIKPL
ncbi:hypothetical protein K3G63_20010 [Hymenobacter sp. HSC-4F20]|uniref:hypothetical protein n=1 Tax=Hymenobacter sp. HSC-4F20 TaxID=2864135 RepID=UPI001C73403C|nr:hypothetical protein [Hymenobacter sp. HSC-4F20]MBX0292741.1 hypothetical protein [Hymenobacter sp. HSC-4F20]